jgi:hypothetical protein
MDLTSTVVLIIWWKDKDIHEQRATCELLLFAFFELEAVSREATRNDTWSRRLPERSH